jgi:hypothetical protein
MSRRITIGLNQKEISNLISELDKTADKLEKMGDKLTDDIAELGLEEMQKNYSSSQYQPSDGMEFAKTGTSKEKKISMIGSQAIYHEFGTGTMGKQSKHPQKYQFGDGLKEYNSGRTIRRNTKANSIASQLGIPVNGLYWTYKDENGWIHYTQGISAQKVVFDANKAMKEKLPELCKKAVEEVLK